MLLRLVTDEAVRFSWFYSASSKNNTVRMSTYGVVIELSIKRWETKEEGGL